MAVWVIGRDKEAVSKGDRPYHILDEERVMYKWIWGYRHLILGFKLRAWTCVKQALVYWLVQTAWHWPKIPQYHQVRSKRWTWPHYLVTQSWDWTGNDTILLHSGLIFVSRVRSYCCLFTYLYYRTEHFRLPDSLRHLPLSRYLAVMCWRVVSVNTCLIRTNHLCYTAFLFGWLILYSAVFCVRVTQFLSLLSDSSLILRSYLLRICTRVSRVLTRLIL